MSKRYTFLAPHRPGALYGELQAAIPALAPRDDPDGRRYAVFSLSSRTADDGTPEITLEVPNGVTESELAAVLAAHDPTTPPPPPPPPDPRALFAAALAEARTLAEVKAAFLDTTHGYRVMIKPAD